MRLPRFISRLLGRPKAQGSFIIVGGGHESRSAAGERGRNANVIRAPVQWIMRAFGQADLIVQERQEGQWYEIEDHPATALLAAPNRFYDGDSLLKALVLSYFIDGNAYVLKVRSPLRRVVELWYVPHWLIEPKWPDDGSTFISHYEYRPRGQAIPVHVDDVVHLRFGLDPDNPRLGLSPLRPVLQEAMTDEEAAAFSAYILKNMGVPGGIISPKDANVGPSDDDVQAMKEHMKSQFTGRKRGDWLVMGAPTEISQFGFDPNRLMLGPLRDISEERVCAMLGLPAAVVGFGTGLQQTKVGATMRELVRLARVNCVEPTQTSIGRQLSRQLLPEFDDGQPRRRITFDNASVSIFAEDETDRANRAATLVKASVITVAEGQAVAGVRVDPEANVYLRPSQVTAVESGGAPKPPPAPTNRLTQDAHPNGRGKP